MSSSGAGDDERLPVALDIVGAGVGRGEHELVLVDAIGRDEHDAAPLELPRDPPVAPRLPPCFENMCRTSEAVRFRLSVSASTITATPSGP